MTRLTWIKQVFWTFNLGISEIWHIIWPFWRQSGRRCRGCLAFPAFAACRQAVTLTGSRRSKQSPLPPNNKIRPLKCHSVPTERKAEATNRCTLVVQLTLALRLPCFPRRPSSLPCWPSPFLPIIFSFFSISCSSPRTTIRAPPAAALAALISIFTRFPVHFTPFCVSLSLPPPSRCLPASRSLSADLKGSLFESAEWLRFSSLFFSSQWQKPVGVSPFTIKGVGRRGVPPLPRRVGWQEAKLVSQVWKKWDLTDVVFHKGLRCVHPDALLCILGGKSEKNPILQQHRSRIFLIFFYLPHTRFN